MTKLSALGFPLPPANETGSNIFHTVFDPSGTPESFSATWSQLKEWIQLGLFDDRGNYDASVDLYPSTGGSGAAGAVLKGDVWFVTVAGTIDGVDIPVGSSLRALDDAPAQDSSKWAVTLAASVGKVQISKATGAADFYDTVALANAASSAGDVIKFNTDLTENISLLADRTYNLSGHTLTGTVTNSGTVNARLWMGEVIHNHLTEHPISLSSSSEVDAMGITFKNNLGETINVDSGSKLKNGNSIGKSAMNSGFLISHHIEGITSTHAIENDGTMQLCYVENTSTGVGIFQTGGEMLYCTGKTVTNNGIVATAGIIRFSTGIAVTGIYGINATVSSVCYNSHGYVEGGASGIGMLAVEAYNCTGKTNTIGIGFTLTNGASCVGTSTLGHGMQSGGSNSEWSNCRAESDGSAGALISNAGFIAYDCKFISKGGSGSDHAIIVGGGELLSDCTFETTDNSAYGVFAGAAANIQITNAKYKTATGFEINVNVTNTDVRAADAQGNRNIK